MSSINQDSSVLALEKKGFKVVHQFLEFPGESDNVVICLTRKTKVGSVHASVDSSGLVNGEDLGVYIRNIGDK